MFRFPFALLCALLVIATTDYAIAKRTFGGGSRHSYPKSGGLSGGGSHSYPSHGGLSGSGGHHGYPSSGGSHSYPSSGGLSGHGTGSGGRPGYPSGGSNTHHSSNHGYPASTGLSGNKPSSGSSNVHYHYHYSPPQQISYTPRYGGAPVSYPVYHGAPPTYVYQYKDSGSKYGTLLAGLALLNLGTLAGTAYAVSKSHSNYKPQPGEICKFGVKKENGDYEETRIDCQLITSFIFQEQAKAQGAATGTNTTVVTTVTNMTTINASGGEVQPAAAAATNETANFPLYAMLPNGTLVPVNTTSNETVAQRANNDAVNNNVTSSVVMTTTNTTTTVTNALDVKGKPVDVTPGMECYVIRTTSTSNMKRAVPCGLLQTYAEKSLKRNSASHAVPTFTLLAAMLTAFIVY